MGNQIRAIAVPLLATAAGLLVGMIFILISGADPGEAYEALLNAVAGEPRMVGETLVATIPLIFTGLAISLAFRCGLFNIGVEGQYLLAQVAAAWAGFALTMPEWLNPTIAGLIHPAIAMFFGMVAGGLWATISGVLKAYRGVHEVINSIMLNYVGLFLSTWLLQQSFLKGTGSSGASTPFVKPTAALTQGLIESSNLHAGLWVALGAAVLVWFFLFKTPYGYEIRAVGLSPGAAEYAGISVPRNIILAMGLSGALAGLAGSVQTLGILGKFYEPMGFVGYGFEGIAVALVGRNHPAGVVLAALLFGALGRGGPAMQAATGLPKEVIWIVQGTVIFFVAAEGLWNFLRSQRMKGEAKA